ncbi:MAG: hypothetical protein ACI4J0_02635 [Huintestinicola sp.]|uniref:hypothetical protein n=1 Tax=Huintestinicola sp. TaxID=2981661 RepID=UPI003F0BA3CE
MLYKKGRPVYFDIVGINFRGQNSEEADPAMRAYTLYLKGDDIEIQERDRFIKDSRYCETEIYKDILQKCCSCSKRVNEEYSADKEWYIDLPYAFMEDIVADVIIETDDINERGQLLEIIDAMLGDDMDHETQTLAGVAVIEAIYFLCGYNFFLDNSDIAGENVMHEAKVLRDYYERNEKCFKTDLNRHK